jgi:hypothetical protein
LKLVSLIVATATALGIYYVFKTVAFFSFAEYVNPLLSSQEWESASAATQLIKIIKYVGVLLACYIAVGFANRAHSVWWQYLVYVVFSSIPVVLLATFPDIEYFDFPDAADIVNNLSRLAYFSLSAFVGVYLGIRFNKLQNI